MNKALAIKVFEEIRDIPYRISLSTREKSNNCVGKHILLLKKLSDLGYNCQYRVCTFNWSDLDLPNELLTIPHENESTHVFLEVEIDGLWKNVDATWDQSLSKILPINSWDGESNTQIAVPVVKLFSIEKSKQIMSAGDNSTIEDLKINGEFYKKINEWLESVRAY